MDSLNSADFEIEDDIDLAKFQTEQKQKEENNAVQTTVKFYTTDAKVFTKSYPSYYTMESIKNSLAQLFNIPYNCLMLLYKEEEVREDYKLHKFKSDKYGILEFKLTSNDKKYKICVENAYKDLTVPDILTVRIQKDRDQVTEIVVEVENQAIEKPYIGGYRDTRTGVQYHHGFSQTGPSPPKVPSEMKNHRDTQTYQMRNRRTDKDYDRASQMQNDNIYISSITDKILTARPYETAEERDKRLDIEGRVRIIQRYFRAWKMSKSLKELSAEYHKRMKLEREREEEEIRQDEHRRKRDLIGKVFPSSMTDFAMLYTMVERWKNSEIDRIRSQHCGAERITEFYLLLEKEIEIIQSIDRLKLKLNKDKETQRIVKFFKTIGQPIEWDVNDKKVSMDTLETQKGREYFDLYQRLCDKNASKEQRIQVYMDIKSNLKTHSCPESFEIIKLVDRACELLARKIEEKYLRDLYKRIESLVMHHFQNVKCNEGVTNRLVQKQLDVMQKELLFCQSCRKLKSVDHFIITARTVRIRNCAECQWIDLTDDLRQDLSPFRFILRQIRNYERLHHGQSSIAFIVQPKGIQFLCNHIWHGHSILSECSDIYLLRLVRWDKNKEWTPWNCILLTAEEAKCHLRIENVTEVYEPELLSDVFNKHALAKKHFNAVNTFNKYFQNIVKGDPKFHEFSDYYNKPSEEKCLDDTEGDDDNSKII